MLDRWSVSAVTTSKGGSRMGQKDRQQIMNNYLGIGVDGQVALDFHKVRLSCRPIVRVFVVVVAVVYHVRSLVQTSVGTRGHETRHTRRRRGRRGNFTTKTW